MSRPLPPGGRPLRSSEAQRAAFAAALGSSVDAAARRRVVSAADALGLALGDDELTIYAGLDSPTRVQAFLNQEIYYNDDHASPEQDETALSPRGVLGAGHAHCFEGALLAYAALLLHGWEPSWVLLEATQDVEHNLVVFRDRAGRFGACAHSSYPHLDGRACEYDSLIALVRSYHPWYYSGRTNDLGDLRLVGFSEPFSLAPRFGAGWITADEPLWRLYHTFIDHSIAFHYLDDPAAAPHAYPLVAALAAGWIACDDAGRPFVAVARLPDEAQALWHRFWACARTPGQRLSDEPLRIEQRFFALTGTTPIDLDDNAADLVWLIEQGLTPAALLPPSSR